MGIISLKQRGGRFKMKVEKKIDIRKVVIIIVIITSIFYGLLHFVFLDIVKMTTKYSRAEQFCEKHNMVYDEGALFTSCIKIHNDSFIDKRYIMYVEGNDEWVFYKN